MIKVEGVIKRFGSLEVLKGVDLAVGKGEIVSLMGPSGAGKTTLLQIIGTLSSADGGRVIVDGVDVLSLKGNALSRFRNERIGFVFQFHQLFAEFTAVENVMMPALIGGKDFKTARRDAMELLEYMNLKERAEHKPNELSGGEKQRVAVARALINHPAVLLADEPSGSLDSKNREELQSLFLQLRAERGQTIFIVTHDEELARQGDRVVNILDGKITN
ncbi:MAG: ABC transporter ATP-binding protein [Paludibacteraceae bacterium]|nr:ABC transporter ATP-binding protein [Paludibacteraceae bacterium]